MEDWYGLGSQNVQLLISCRDAGAMSVSCCANTTEIVIVEICLLALYLYGILVWHGVTVVGFIDLFCW